VPLPPQPAPRRGATDELRVYDDSQNTGALVPRRRGMFTLASFPRRHRHLRTAGDAECALVNDERPTDDAIVVKTWKM
jgi:hypothetical protein